VGFLSYGEALDAGKYDILQETDIYLSICVVCVFIAANKRLQVYAILDEVFLAGEIEETSKQVVLTRLEHLDKLE